MKKNTQTKETRNQQPRQGLLQRVLYGNMVSTDFFARHWIKVFLLVVVAMIFISTKYQCITAMEQIKILKDSLNIARTESVRERSSYMSRTRESAMKALVDSVFPGLAVPEHPAFILNMSENEDAEGADADTEDPNTATTDGTDK